MADPSFPEEPEALEGLHLLKDTVKTAILGTTGRDGLPEASYSPCVIDAKGHFHVYVSALARHTANLKRRGHASVMLIEDESTAENLHARRRATWNCGAVLVERDSDAFAARMQAFRERFGSTSEHLATLLDFSLFRLQPGSGRLVLGFGKAFQLDGWQVQNPMRGRHRPAQDGPMG